MYVELRAKDRNKVEIGDKVRVVFTTLSGKDTPTMSGNIHNISPISSIKTIGGDYRYTVLVSLENPVSFEEKWQVSLVDGLSAEVYFKSSRNTLAQYLLKSNNESISRAWNE